MILDISATFRAAAHRSWENRAALVKALVTPAVLISLLSVLSESYLFAATSPLVLARPLLVIAAASVLLSAVYAVSCHRIILLAPDSLPNPWGIYGSMEQLSFVAWLLIAGLCAGLVSAPFIILVSMSGTTGNSETALDWLAGFPAIYLLARLSVIFPSIAVGDRLNVRDAWSLTQGNGWRLAIAFAIPAWILSGAWELGSLLPVEGLVWRFAMSLGWVIVGAVEVATLSVAYQSLRRTEPA